MVTKKHIIIGGLALVGVFLLVRRASAKPLQCGKGSTFTRMTVEQARAKFGAFSTWPKIEQQVRAFGGTCLATGIVEPDGARPIDESPGGDMPDQVPITHPWQLL